MPQPRSGLGMTRRDYESLRRVHVVEPNRWGVAPGTDFWFSGGAAGLDTAGGVNLLTDGGWTVTSMVFTAGSGADFLSKADPGIAGNAATDAASDLIQSPAIFGSYKHGHQASVIMGAKELPRFLVADMSATFTTSSANETTTNLGFAEDGGSIIVAADSAGTFYGGATFFNSQMNGSALAGNVTKDTAQHWFRIIMDRVTSLATFYMDGLIINAGQTIPGDEAPYSWGFGSGATNRLRVYDAHIFYSWDKPYDYQWF